MEYKRFLMFFVAALLVIGLSACVKPASQAPTGQVTPSATIPVPGSTEDVMGQLESFATQTAMAMLGTPDGQGQETPAATETTAPAAEATATPEATQVPQAPVTEKTPVPVPTSTPGLPTTYTLQKGEFPYCIARRFNIDPNELLNLSGLSRGITYPPGTVLRIPQNASPFPGNRSLRAHPTTITVTSGDTIYSIACEFGDVDPNAIIVANGLASPYTLTPGQSLYIP